MQATSKDTRDLSPRAVAQLLILNVDLYAAERGKEVTRYRISHDAICEVLNRKEMSPEFEERVAGQAFELGWHFVLHTRTDYALIKCDKVDVWPKLSAKRLLPMIDVGATSAEGLEEHIDDAFDTYLAAEEKRRKEEIDRKAADL